MDLRNGAILMHEILSNSRARAVLTEELPQVMASPLVGMAGNLSLNQVLALTKGRVPSGKVAHILKRLQETP